MDPAKRCLKLSLPFVDGKELAMLETTCQLQVPLELWTALCESYLRRNLKTRRGEPVAWPEEDEEPPKDYFQSLRLGCLVLNDLIFIYFHHHPAPQKYPSFLLCPPKDVDFVAVFLVNFPGMSWPSSWTRMMHFAAEPARTGRPQSWMPWSANSVEGLGAKDVPCVDLKKDTCLAMNVRIFPRPTVGIVLQRGRAYIVCAAGPTAGTMLVVATPSRVTDVTGPCARVVTICTVTSVPRKI